MKSKPIVVKLVIDRRAAGVILAAVAVGALALRLSSETLTLTTTYPAPVGVYNQIVTTGNSGTVPADTTLARSAGNVILVPASNAAGKVGVGVAAPMAKLDVNGTIRVGALVSDPPSGTEGLLYYNSVKKNLRVFGAQWGDLNGAPQGGLCGFTSTPGLGSAVTYPCIGVDPSASCPSGYAQLFLGVGTSCVKL